MSKAGMAWDDVPAEVRARVIETLQREAAHWRKRHAQCEGVERRTVRQAEYVVEAEAYEAAIRVLEV